ncbi:MAG: hypothetical protein JF564_04735 [Sphingomonas sp.]|nr:hypothetical protein [Sphingomonas sp.]
MENCQTLIAEHDLLDRLSAALIDITEDPQSDIVEVLFIRANLSIVLGDHLGRENPVSYDERISTRPDRFPAGGAKFNTEFAGFTSAWQHYLMVWTPSTRTLMTWLRQCIGNETALPYPLALATSPTWLRAAA